MKLTDLNAGEVVELKNQEEIDAIVKIADDLGLRWHSGNEYTGFKMPIYYEKCYINFALGTYCHEDAVKGKNYKVYPASLFIKEPQTLTFHFKKYEFDGKFVETLYYINEGEIKKISVSYYRIYKEKWNIIASDGYSYKENLYIMEE